MDQLTGLHRNHSETAHKHDRHEDEEGRSEIADLKLPEHEGKEGHHPKQQSLLTLTGLVRAQSPQNHTSHRQTNHQHHNRFDHAAVLDMLVLLSKTAGEGVFSIACPEEAGCAWGCQVDAAEQRVGFFNQELRPINLQSAAPMMAAKTEKICLIGDRGRTRSGFRDHALD